MILLLTHDDHAIEQRDDRARGGSSAWDLQSASSWT